MKKRHTAVKNAGGWYKTIDRVTHLLTANPSSMSPTSRMCLDPVLDRGETYPHHNLYFIESDTWDLEILGGLLMSAVGQFFVESYGVRMRGGYWRFQAQYLRGSVCQLRRPFLLTKLKIVREAFRQRDRTTRHQ